VARPEGAADSVRPTERPPAGKPPLAAAGGPSAARPGEAARFRSAGGAASCRKATIGRCRRALRGPTGRSRPIPFGRRSGLLQKTRHCPLQDGPLRPDRAKPPAMIRHRPKPSRSLSRGAEHNRSQSSIPAPPIPENQGTESSSLPVESAFAYFCRAWQKSVARKRAARGERGSRPRARVSGFMCQVSGGRTFRSR
jgi:hypothetical protein